MPTRTRKHRGGKHSGGKFVAKGEYGCVFNPALKCIGKSRPDALYVSKMLPYKKNAVEEFQISNMVKLIDPTRTYFITAESMCEHDQTDIKFTNETPKCSFFPLKTPSYLIMYEYGGPDLSRLTVPANLYPEFFLGLIGLIQGLIVLHANEMVHLDIKPGNMVGKLHDNRYNIRYIDLGLSRPIASLNAKSGHVQMIRTFNLKTPYPYYPFDTIMLSLDRQKNPVISQEEIDSWYSYQKIINDLHKTIPRNSYWEPNMVPKYTSRNLSEGYARTAGWYGNLSNHLKSIDMYSLAVSLCQIYKRLTGHVYVYDSNGKATIAISTDTNSYTLDSLKLKVSNEIFNFHNKLSLSSMAFYEQMNRVLRPFGNLRPTANEMLKPLAFILGATDDVFGDSAVTYKALKAVGVKIEEPIRIKQISSDFTGVSELTDPNSVVLSYISNASNPIENLPLGWEKRISSRSNMGKPYYYELATGTSQWERPPQWVKPPQRPPGEPLQRVATNIKFKPNPLQNLTKKQSNLYTPTPQWVEPLYTPTPQWVEPLYTPTPYLVKMAISQLRQKRTRKNRRSN